MIAWVALLLLAMVSIQTGASFAKTLFPLAGAAGTTALRLFFATLLLWGFWRPWRFKLTRPQLKLLALYGMSLGFMNLTFYFALERIPLGLTVTLEFIGPLALSILTSRKRIDFFWAFLAGLGIFMVMPTSSLNQSLDPIGIGFALLAGFFWALYILFGQRAGSKINSGLATSVGMLFASLVALPFGLLIDGPKLLNTNLYLMGFLVAVLSSALPYSLEMVSMKKIPTKTFGILMSLEPAVASLIGVLFLRETLTLVQCLAIFFVIVASLGSSYTTSPQTSPS